MGTNYYLNENACDKCGRWDEPLHIGKSSFGWCFGLHVIPEESLNDLPDWVARWSKPGCVIKDEYGDTISGEEMLLVITNRFRDKPPMERGWLQDNDAEPGPNNLARHHVGRFCVKHGEGTWDCLSGEFS